MSADEAAARRVARGSALRNAATDFGMKTIASFAVAVTLAGCASTLSSMQTAVPVEPRHVEATVGYGLYLPLGPATQAIAQGVKQTKNALEAAGSGTKYQLSEEDQQALITAGIGLATM